MSMQFPNPAQTGRLQWRDKHQPSPFPHAVPTFTEWIGDESEDPNLLYEGDNLAAAADLIVRGLRERFHLVYLDPPFCSGRSYKKTIRLHGQPAAPQRNMKLVQYEDSWDEDSYLQFCYERLLAAKALLHPEGSLVLHVDEHMSHMLRCVLDEVFGRANFINEIVWHYPDNFQGNVKGLANNHNLLFWYKKSPLFKSNPVRIPLDKPKKRDRRVWDKELKKVVAARDENGSILYDIYTDRKADDVWRIGQSSVTKTRSHEHTGYPTQKPELLLKRIIEATTDPNDWVFDGFSGSGTTAATAQKLGRRWAVCDQNRTAIHTLSDRLHLDRRQKRPEGPSVQDGLSVIHLCLTDDSRTPAGKAIVNVTVDSIHACLEVTSLELLDSSQPGQELSANWVETIDSVRIDCAHREGPFRSHCVEIPSIKELAQLKHQFRADQIGDRYAVRVVDVYGREFTATGLWPTVT